MKEEHKLNTLTDGAFTTADMIAQEYLSMSRDQQIQVTNIVDHHEKDANGEPIPHDDEEGNQVNEVESAYKDKIAAFKRAGGTIKKHSPDQKRIN